jgi:hypothetical protein
MVRLEGGAPGKPGAAGKAGKGGASKGCLVYSTAAGANGLPGQPGSQVPPARRGVDPSALVSAGAEPA